MPERPIPRFGGYAARYHAYRPHYPARVFDRLTEEAGDHRDRAVDLGAGTGQATGDLLDRFRQVVAVEPDADMAALIPQNPLLQVQIRPAEDVEFDDGRLDAAMAANSLHWMDGPRVCRKVGRWLRPGAAFVAFGFGHVQYPGAPEAVMRTLNSEAKLWRPHTHERLVDWREYDEVLSASGAFARVEAFEIYSDLVWTPLELAGFMMTTSSGSAYADARGGADEALNALTYALEDASGGRAIPVRLPVIGALGWR